MNQPTPTTLRRVCTIPRSSRILRLRSTARTCHSRSSAWYISTPASTRSGPSSRSKVENGFSSATLRVREIQYAQRLQAAREELEKVERGSGRVSLRGLVGLEELRRTVEAAEKRGMVEDGEASGKATGDEGVVEGRYKEKIKALRGELEVAYKQSSVHSEKHLERIKELEQALEGAKREVEEAREGGEEVKQRYETKIKALRGELETAYKQSTVHSENHLERIKDLETALERARNEASAASRYAEKNRSLKEELDTAYKRSDVHSRKHVERIQKLEKALDEARNYGKEVTKRSEERRNTYAGDIAAHRKRLNEAYSQLDKQRNGFEERIRILEAEIEALQETGGTVKANEIPTADTAAELSQAEGDLAGGVAKFGQTEKWYKQPAVTPAGIRKRMEALEQKKRDSALVREIRDIYERAYGIIGSEAERHPEVEAKEVPVKPIKIDSNRLQEIKRRLQEKMSGVERNGKEMGGKKVVEVESDVDLGEALASYEREQKEYKFDAKEPWDNILAAKEREAHEGIKLVNDEAPKLIPTELPSAGVAAETAFATQETSGMRWAEPPLYKVLAYDSGNDMMSTASTTSNFTGAETPISISDALSQLYSPAKFLPHFAGLQEEGYQVVYGAKDLVVMRKVQGKHADADVIESGLEDHGVMAPGRSTQASHFESEGERRVAANVNPVDGTPRVSRAEVVEPALQPELKERLIDGHDYEIRHYPRVRREEDHFTGTKRKWKPASESRQARREQRLRERMAASEAKDRKGSTALWVLKIGAGAAVVSYLVGAAAERGRENGREAAVVAVRKEREGDMVRRREG